MMRKARLFMVLCILTQVLFYNTGSLLTAHADEISGLPANIPDGMKLPDGLAIPDGMKLPDGVTIPDGMKLPDGMTIPDPGSLPAGVDLNQMMQSIPGFSDVLNFPVPTNQALGLPNDLDLKKILITAPGNVETVLTENVFDASNIGKTDIAKISNPSEKEKFEIPTIDTSTFEGYVEKTVLDIFKSEIETMLPQISAIILAEVDASTEDILKVILEKGISTVKLKTTATELDFSDLPSKQVVDSIPAQILPQVQANVQLMVTQEIHNQMKDAVIKTQENTAMVITACIEDIKGIVKGTIQKITPQAAKKIHTLVDAKIDEKVSNALLNNSLALPKEYAGMNKDAIQQKMIEKISPKVEKYIRPIVLERIKASVDEIIIQKIQIPILTKMQPQFDDLTDARIRETVDQMPAYMEKVISKKFIEAVVKSKVGWVKSQIDQMVRNSNNELHAVLEAYIDQEITNETKIYLGNLKISTDAKPINVNNRLLLPFRAISEELGAQVQWIPESRQVVMKKDGKELILKLDSQEVSVNGEKVTLDVAPQISEGRTMVPIRFIGETFGLKVNWDRDWKMVSME